MIQSNMHEKEPTGIGKNALETEGIAVKSGTIANNIIEAFGFDKKEAAMTQRLPYLISPIPMPVFELLIYHFGQNHAFIYIH